MLRQLDTTALQLKVMNAEEISDMCMSVGDQIGSVKVNKNNHYDDDLENL